MSIKKEFLLSLLIALVSTSLARAGISGLNILSEEYHIEGEYRSCLGVFNYDFTSSDNISNAIGDYDLSDHSYDYYYNVAKAGRLYIDAYVFTSNPYDCDAHISATSSARLLFKPTQGSLIATIFGRYEYEENPRAILKDLTTDITLLDHKVKDFDQSFSWQVNTQHIYEFYLYVHVYGFNYDSERCYAYVDLRSVPAPGALFLSSIGMGFVGWLRKNRILSITT